MRKQHTGERRVGLKKARIWWAVRAGRVHAPLILRNMPDIFSR